MHVVIHWRRIVLAPDLWRKNWCIFAAVKTFSDVANSERWRRWWRFRSTGQLGLDELDVTGRDGTGRDVCLQAFHQSVGSRRLSHRHPRDSKSYKSRNHEHIFCWLLSPPNKILGNSGGSRKWPHFSHFYPERCQNSLIIVLKIRGIQTKSMTAMTLTCFKFQPMLLQDVARRWCRIARCPDGVL